ncbi:hypothetical protein MNBD_BACTEROID01-430 [hydrothermal vent metagenome]|uniref:Uncharacterized protein n=1 Tax=hydrothermal vent metagenome TaxID=652676 RepID=A0A3B0TTN4_9ZZZZ
MDLYNHYLKISAVLVLMAMHFSTYAQSDGQADVSFSVPEVALVDIEPSGFGIELSLAAKSGGGLPIEPAVPSGGKIWLNYTSSLATGSNTRSVSVQVINGKVPSGIILLLQASADAGNGRGNTGIPAGRVHVSTSPQVIISGIGRCYTGNGPGYGHQLSYSLMISDYAELDFDESTTLQIAYTITDN